MVSDLKGYAEMYNQDEKNNGRYQFHKIDNDIWIKIDWENQSAGDLLSNAKVVEELDAFFEEKRRDV